MRRLVAIAALALTGCENHRYVGPTLRLAVGWNGIEASVILLDSVASGGGAAAARQAKQPMQALNDLDSKNPVPISQ